MDLNDSLWDRRHWERIQSGLSEQALVVHHLVHHGWLTEMPGSYESVPTCQRRISSPHRVSSPSTHLDCPDRSRPERAHSYA
jgi:hypothetical protein